MPARKRRFVVPVLPAVGLAAVAAGPMAQAFSPLGSGPLSTTLISRVQSAPSSKTVHDDDHGKGDKGKDPKGKDPKGKDPKGAKNGDGKGDKDPHRRRHHPVHKKGSAPTTTTTADPTTTTSDPTTTTSDLTTTTTMAPTTTTTMAPTTTTTMAPTTTTDPTTTTTMAPTTTTDPTTTTTIAPTTTTDPTTTTIPPTTTTDPTTTTIPPTTTTAAPTTTTTTLPPADLTTTEAFTRLVHGSPMGLSVSGTNTSGKSHTYTITVEVKGTLKLPNFLNVNSDSSYAPLPANWSCSPGAYDPSTTDNLFTCTATLAAGQTTTVMVSTGSNFSTLSKGTGVTVIAKVTAEDGSISGPLPAPVTTTGTIA